MGFAELVATHPFFTLTGDDADFLCYHQPVPIFYECQRCTACCRWPGQVRLSDDEISRLAAFKGMKEFDFIQEFTRLRADRQGLALKDKSNGECIFLDGNDCAVQRVKPTQCRAFPNLWNFPGFEKICRAIPRNMTPEEFIALTKSSRKDARARSSVVD